MKKKKTVPTSKAPTPQKSLSKKKIMLFKVIAVLLPFFFLILIELGLRLFGYGHNLNLFIKDPDDKHYLGMNKYVSQKYFTASENATVGNYELFKKKKSPETVRIFVLGESTTQGFPYMHNGSFHRWLQYRLMRTFPEKNFEIINLSLTAVNSYTVLDFAKQIVGYEPDAVLIYVGHNEYYGALGVGSTSNIGNNLHLIRLKMKLREFRLVQLIYGIRNALSGKKVNLNQRLIQRMASDQHIPYQSDKYERGIRQFETNMNDVCQLFSKKKIPVFISNLVSNEKDLKPFISDTLEKSRSASYQYEQARHAYTKNDYKLAKQLYIQAKELDLLRFRAPEEMNLIISKIVVKYPGVYLVDAKTLFEQHSPHGIIGNETLLEHVHPNLYGYALLSDAFYHSMKQQGIIKLGDKHEMSFEQLLERMPLTKVDSLKGAYIVEEMKKDWPFNKTIESKIGASFEDSLANHIALTKIHWGPAMYSLLQHYAELNNWKEAFRVAEGGVLEYPYDIRTYLTAVEIAKKINDDEQIAFYLSKAFQIKPDFEIAQNLVVLHMKLDQPELSIPYLDYFINNHLKQAESIKTTLKQVISLKNDIRTDSANVGALNSIATMYFKLNLKELAMKYVGKALKKDPRNKSSLEIMNEIETSSQPKNGSSVQ